jgi:AraC family transcriptional regulator
MSASATVTSNTTLLQLHPEAGAHGALLKAPSLLRKEDCPQAGEGVRRTRGRLLPWRVRKLCEYIDSEISGSILVADLCTLVGLSKAHFARSFTNTFGISPYAFVARRRLDLAVSCMLHTDAPLSDIAARCGFADQAHLSKRFRKATGWTPAAWRRWRRTPESVDAEAYQVDESQLP